MSKQKKAPTSAATLVEAAERTRECGSHSQLHDTMKPGAGSIRISDLLHQGKENALTLKDLVKITGMDERLIRRKIHLERASGTVIVSDNQSGYFLPGDSADVRRFYRSMAHRAAEINKIALAAESALAETEGQTTVEGW